MYTLYGVSIILYKLAEIVPKSMDSKFHHGHYQKSHWVVGIVESNFLKKSVTILVPEWNAATLFAVIIDKALPNTRTVT